MRCESAMRANVVRLLPEAAHRRTLDVVADRVSILWNAANYICRQRFIAKQGVPRYADLCRLMVAEDVYRRLPSDVAQEVLKKLAEAWRSYFTLRAKWSAGTLQDKPGLPKYRKNKDGLRRRDLIPIKSVRSYSFDRSIVSVTLPSDLRGFDSSRGRLVLNHRGLRRWNGAAGRAEILRYGRRWYFKQSVEVVPSLSRPWKRAAAIDLGVRILASLSVEGEHLAHHFSACEPLKDFDYFGRAIAQEQQRLRLVGRTSSVRLTRLHRLRRKRVEHAWEALAARVVAICSIRRVGTVYVGWPKGILRERIYGSGRWAERIHNFWSFEMSSRILEKHLRRAGIEVVRVGERGTSSICPHDDPASPAHVIVRSPRAWIACKTCRTTLHSDQVGSRNILRFAKPDVCWDGLEASPGTVTLRWNGHRWTPIPNPMRAQLALTRAA